MAATAMSSFASRTRSARRLRKPINFAATCPSCGHPRVQYAYTRRALLRLIGKAQVIDAYCGTCDVVWAVSQKELGELAAAVRNEQAAARVPH